jgi:transcriptional regulator with XRE-family HTH domain
LRHPLNIGGFNLRKALGSARQQALIYLLIAKREAAGLTQAELAAKLGEYQSFVARLESGQRRVDVVEFLELAEALGFDAVRTISNLKKIT